MASNMYRYSPATVTKHNTILFAMEQNAQKKVPPCTLTFCCIFLSFLLKILNCDFCLSLPCFTVLSHAVEVVHRLAVDLILRYLLSRKHLF